MTRLDARLLLSALAFGLAVALAGNTAAAQTDAGTVASIQGRVQIQRRGVWQEADIGAGLQIGDRLRTGADERAKLVFRDDSVLDVAPDTELALDEQVVDSATQHYQSALRLFNGKVHAWVGSQYASSQSRYEIETPNAVASVHGTEFIMSHTPASDITEVVGIADVVEVVGKLAVMGGGGVQVGAHMITRVQKGRLPGAPEHVDEAHWRQYFQGLDLIGTGRRDGLNVLHPIVAGRIMEPDDVPGGKEHGPADKNGSPATHAPEMFLADRLSLDVYANTQPLLGFEANRPGRTPPGSVRVGF